MTSIKRRVSNNEKSKSLQETIKDFEYDPIWYYDDSIMENMMGDTIEISYFTSRFGIPQVIVDEIINYHKIYRGYLKPGVRRNRDRISKLDFYFIAEKYTTFPGFLNGRDDQEKVFRYNKLGEL